MGVTPSSHPFTDGLSIIKYYKSSIWGTVAIFMEPPNMAIYKYEHINHIIWIYSSYKVIIFISIWCLFPKVTAPVEPICQATRSRINAAGSEGTSRPERGDSMLDRSGCLCAETERVLYPKGPFGQWKRKMMFPISGYTWIFGQLQFFSGSLPVHLVQCASLARPLGRKERSQRHRFSRFESINSHPHLWGMGTISVGLCGCLQKNKTCLRKLEGLDR